MQKGGHLGLFVGWETKTDVKPAGRWRALSVDFVCCHLVNVWDIASGCTHQVATCMLLAQSSFTRWLHYFTCVVVGL